MTAQARSLAFALVVAMVAASSALSHAQPPVSSAPVPQPSGPAGDADRSFIEATCTSCHPIAQVTTRHMTAGEWAATVDKMIALGAQVTTQEDRDRIIAWLAAHQGPQH